MNVKKRQQLAALKAASPLQMAGALKQMELYDKKTAQEIIDEIYEKYATGQDLQDEVVEPVMLSVLDGLLEKHPWGRNARRKGLTATRVVSECRTFTYNDTVPSLARANGYNEFKNMRDHRGEGIKKTDVDSRSLDDINRRNDIKERKFMESENGMIRDDFTGELLHRCSSEKGADNRFGASVDHVMPLAKLRDKYLGNYALTKDDIKKIANSDYNLAVTGKSFNSSKNDDTVPEFIEKKKDVLTKETKGNLQRKFEEAQSSIDNAVNLEVAKTLVGQGSQDGKFVKVAKNVGMDAGVQQLNYMAGNIILYIVKPLYYELSDIVRNGFKNGVGVDSFKEAMRIRFGRVKAYVVENAKNFKGDNLGDFVNGFVSSLIEGIIGLFTGLLRNFLKLCKEGVRIFSSSWKIMKGEEGAKLSSAEKKQAIAKIIGTGVIAVAGIALDEWLQVHLSSFYWIPFVKELGPAVISTMLSGIAATLFFYFLNKADLFSVKAERRHARLEEIFSERIKEIETTAESMNTTALETMRQQREEFETVCDGIEEGLANDDIDKISAGWYRMADFLHVDLPFHGTEEFLDHMDRKIAESSAK